MLTFSKIAFFFFSFFLLAYLTVKRRDEKDQNDGPAETHNLPFMREKEALNGNQEFPYSRLVHLTFRLPD